MTTNPKTASPAAEFPAGFLWSAAIAAIARPRIQPDGRGAPNPKELDYYKRLVDATLAFRT